MKYKLFFIAFISIALCLFISCNQKHNIQGVKLNHSPEEKKVDVFFDGKLFTAFIYPDQLMKPVLWPVYTSKGTEITRKYPMKKAAGERADHPHHVGIWFNYGDVNGIDYWGHSLATPDSNRHRYGTIKLVEVVETKSGDESGLLSFKNEWIGGGQVQLFEQTSITFINQGNTRIIDWNCNLTANHDVVFNDTKEGMFAIRLSRELELPSENKVLLTDVNGEPVNEKVVDNTSVSGNYLSNAGVTGAEVWGTRAKWMKLYGNYGEEKVAVVIIDHINNPGYPAYWHARDYGLFSVNPLGQKTFSEGKEEMNLSLKKGESVNFKYRVLICSGEISDNEIEQFTSDFINL